MVTKEETSVIISSTNNLPEKVSPISMIHPSSTDREGNSSIVPEKPSEDGYNWRKYGQKNVKGNEYIRSYYKCSHPNCQVKKQVERSHDGRITDITYLGNHYHVKPHSDSQTVVPSLLSVKVQIPDSPMVAVEEDTPSNVPACTTENVEEVDVGKLAIVKVSEGITPRPLTPSSQVRDDRGDNNLTLKKRKKGIDGSDSTPEKANHESRVVVRTISEVDILNDGYRWRKYGQKMVKGNPYPRSYYRCSTTGCQVKKHVERASHDPKVVITTYEGEHDHSIPPVRTIVPQSTGTSGHLTESNGMSKTKSDESQPEKSDSTEPSTTTKPENELPIAVLKTCDRISQPTNEETGQTEPITQMAQEEKAQKDEPNKKPEILSAEAKRSDAKSNGLQRPTPEAVNC